MVSLMQTTGVSSVKRLTAECRGLLCAAFAPGEGEDRIRVSGNLKYDLELPVSATPQ